MSKLQPAPEVLLSIDARRSKRGRTRLSAVRGLACVGLIASTGCLGPETSESTSNVVLSSDTSDGTTGGGESTLAPIMTTTEEPETTHDSSSSSSSSGESTTGVPVGCGDGAIQAPEECDYGNDNADDAECTSECKKATCGDGKVFKDEACDDGVNDGGYGGCAPGCAALGPHCGDGEVQGAEACDEADPKGGCLVETCQFAQSCRQIRDAFIAEDLADGVYTIKPANKEPVKVLCDMDADGGGYTFLKVALPDGQTANAIEAEAECDKVGMDLLVPRSPMHVVAATLAAKSALLDPIGGGTTKGSVNYLSIFGIYPVTPGQSCVGKAVNSVACPQWQAKGGTFWVTDAVFPGQPAASNCEGCSMAYEWSEAGMLIGVEAFKGLDNGAAAELFMCDTGDKQAPV